MGKTYQKEFLPHCKRRWAQSYNTGSLGLEVRVGCQRLAGTGVQWTLIQFSIPS